MISHKHKCIFVHIPKCGGSSIEDILWPGERSEKELFGGFVSRYRNRYQTGGLQHLYARYILDSVGQGVFNHYFKFAFVRNPWSRCVSQYCYMKQRKDLRLYIGMGITASFREYLDCIVTKEHVQWAPQYKFITDENGGIMVDFIGRLEQLKKDLCVVANKTGIDLGKIPHKKKTRHRPYYEYYDDETLRIVGDMYGRDIELLGYDFR